MSYGFLLYFTKEMPHQGSRSKQTSSGEFAVRGGFVFTVAAQNTIRYQRTFSFVLYKRNDPPHEKQNVEIWPVFKIATGFCKTTDMSARVFFCQVQKKGLTRSKQELANPKFQSQAVRRFVKTMGRSAVAGQSVYISFVKYKKKAYQTDGQSRSAS